MILSKAFVVYAAKGTQLSRNDIGEYCGFYINGL